jgi:hypothetical protein
MPAQVFNARTIWAQWLMLPIYSWVLWFLAGLVDPLPRHSKRRIIAALALSWIGCTVHLAGLVFLPVVIGALLLMARGQRVSRPAALSAMLLGSLPALLLVPSAVDWAQHRNNGARPKPAHIAKFESLMPPPLPPARRVVSSIADEYNAFANVGQADDLVRPLPVVLRRTVRACDAVFLVFALIGTASAVLIATRPRTNASPKRTVAILLLSWIFIPTIAGSLVLSRANGSYFAPAIPAIFLLTALPVATGAINRWMQLVAGTFAALAGAGYCVFTIAITNTIDQTSMVKGQYYIPLREQQAFAQQLAKKNVSARRLTHLSGDWFQRPYEYLLSQVCGVKELSADPHWAVIEDSSLRTNQQLRVQFFAPRATLRQGTVAAAIFDHAEDATRFVDSYYAVPIR